MILFIIIFGSMHIDTANYSDFAPFGVGGVMKGAGIVFFSFIGFDSVSTLAGEVKNPGRNLPIGIVGTLAIATVLYCAVAIVMTGMVRYDLTDKDAPLATAFHQIGYDTVAAIVGFGAITTLTATTLCSLLGQPRIYFQMAQDGLLFRRFMVVSRKTGVPEFGTVLTGIGAGLLAVLFPIDQLASVISIGTLLAFAVVCGGLLVLRYAPPASDRSRASRRVRQLVPGIVCVLAVLAFSFALAARHDVSFVICALMLWLFVCVTAYLAYYVKQQPCTATFACPLVPAVPAAGLFVNCYLLAQLDGAAFLRAIVWTLIGLLIYVFYGIRHSQLNFVVDNDSDRADDGDDVSDNDNDVDYVVPLDEMSAGMGDRHDSHVRLLAADALDDAQ
eukprot:TRINITY_DN8319_c0_g1_i1.p1 TRINITY_DN8319_c0_g1~~TRINITY_DN8319_c0_g1_i1.p1  ORF type:complete len:388 (-),score=79.95 TRINITY_DN8319_c0_g1_i1:24-1187(-)